MKISPIFVMFLIAIASMCDTATQLLLKHAINSLKEFHPDTVKKIAKFIFKIIIIPRAWGAFMFSVLSLCIWLFVLSKVDLNFAFSLDSMEYIFIGFASAFFLKEKVSFSRWAGTILIVIGIILVSLS